MPFPLLLLKKATKIPSLSLGGNAAKKQLKKYVRMRVMIFQEFILMMKMKLKKLKIKQTYGFVIKLLCGGFETLGITESIF